jgi:hypothetical protein
MMSLGRIARPDTAFSAAGTSAVTRMGRRRAATMRIAPRTAAPPDMSVCIIVIASPCLMLSPPVSNVIPLPTSTTWRVAGAERGRHRASISRGGVADPPPTASTPPKPCALSHCSSRTVTSTPIGLRTSCACAPSHAGFFVDDGSLARSRAHAVAPAVALARARTAPTPPSSTGESTGSSVSAARSSSSSAPTPAPAPGSRMSMRRGRVGSGRDLRVKT